MVLGKNERPQALVLEGMEAKAKGWLEATEREVRFAAKTTGGGMQPVSSKEQSL